MRSCLLCFLLIFPIFGQQKPRIITNFDLEKYKQKRLEADSEYLRTYQNKGMPSPEEIERIIEERRKRNTEIAQRVNQERSKLEEYFQRRADELKLQIASLDAQISYLRRVIAEDLGVYRGGLISRPVLAGSFIVGGIGGVNSRVFNLPPNVQMVQSYSLGVPTATDIRNLVNGTAFIPPSVNFQSSPFRGFVFFPVIVDKADYRREQRLNELQTLERIRAGVLAELSMLQDQARRAGVKIQ